MSDTPQVAGDLATQLMLMTLFRIISESTENPSGFLAAVREALNTLAQEYPLPGFPADAEQEVRSFAQEIIGGVLKNAAGPQTH
jgi:hypothetical protein